MKKTFCVKSWDKFQHYKDRNPPWIKLHNHLLDDYDFEELPDTTKCHLLCIWMLASRTNNKMVHDSAWVKRKIGANSSVDLKLLESRGFIEVHTQAQGASNVLVSEEKRRDRGETEERQSRADSISSDLDFTSLEMTDGELTEVKRIRKKNKGGEFTDRVIKGLAKEFETSRANGFTNDQILTEWETRSWKSFKAEWMPKSKQSKQTHSFESQIYQSGKI